MKKLTTEELEIEELEQILAKKKMQKNRKEKEETKQIKLKKKLGFSERLVLGILMLSWAVVLLGVVYTFKFIANEVWSYLLDVVKWLSTGTIGFFIWKARGENLVKIKSNPDFDLEDYVQQALNSFGDESSQM